MFFWNKFKKLAQKTTFWGFATLNGFSLRMNRVLNDENVFRLYSARNESQKLDSSIR